MLESCCQTVTFLGEVQDGQIAQIGVDLAPLDDRAIVIDATG